MLKLLGSWSQPLTSVDVQDLQAAIERFDCKCQFCGLQTHLSPKVPLGHFDVCVRDRSLPNEPANWVPLCKMCVTLNDIRNLDKKGSFIEAPWCSQSRLTNVLRLSYAISLSPELEWGALKEASSRFLIAIDNSPKEWATVEWSGEVSGLSSILSNSPFPYADKAYLHALRFRFDMEPFKDAIAYWTPSLEQQVRDVSEVR